MLESNHLTKFVLDNTPRMLSWIDRRIGSPTYGCSDRNFWHYKIVDFPCAMLQETSLTLALLYSESFYQNKFYKNKYIKELIIAQIKYWIKIQNKNGSFDEFFPNEESFSATAFTLYSNCLAIELIEEDPKFFQKNASKACKFLLSYSHPGATNQIAAAIAGINRYSILFSDNTFKNDLNNLVKKIIDSSNDEGWNSEYGGFDVGYESITLAYLADYNLTNKNSIISNNLIKSIEFLSNFIHPDGTVGGIYGSRNTSFFAPFGFACSIKKSDIASSVINEIFLPENSNVNKSIDDRYICHFLLPSYLLSIKFLKKSSIKTSKLPHEKIFSEHYFQSGIYIKSTEKYYFIANLKKNGVFQIYNKNSGESIIDSGYVLENNKYLLITNWLNDISKIDVNDQTLIIKGNLFFVSNKIPSSIMHMLLRVLTFFGKGKILPLLKKYFISREKKIKGNYNRTIVFEGENIFIYDKFTLNNRQILNIYESNDSASFRYVAPSNYFQYSEIQNNNHKHLGTSYISSKNKEITKKIDLKSFKVFR